MNFEYFIAKRISNSKYNKSLSHVFIRIAVGASALSLIVIILSFSLLDGFKSTIKNKLAGFGAHIIVTRHDSNNSYQTTPIKKDQKIIDLLVGIDGVKHVQTFALKAGLIKTASETQGVVLKGVSEDFNWSFFEENLVKGRHFDVQKSEKTGKEVIISETLAKRTKLDTGDNLYMYFIDNQARMRKYKIVGIYNTGMIEFDEMYILADIHDVEKLNDWNYYKNEEVSGYEVLINKFSEIDQVYQRVEDKIGFRFDINGEKLQVNSLQELYPQIFDWLSLLDINALVLLIIMVTIAAINMITALLILILERTRLIGILKAVGTQNWSIRKIFIFNGLNILIRGLIWGNLIGISLLLIQYYTHIIPLNPELYYMDYVPMEINFLKILIANVGMIFITFLILIIPSVIIAKIPPVKAIKFD